MKVRAEVDGSMFRLDEDTPRSHLTSVSTLPGEAPVASPSWPSEAAPDFTIRARTAARELSSRVSQEQRDALYAELDQLKQRQFEVGTLPRKELSRLKMVQWQIETIEEADLGDTFDMYRNVVRTTELLADKIDNFQKEIKGLQQRRGVHKKGRR